jgi:hypothetical protein
LSEPGFGEWNIEQGILNDEGERMLNFQYSFEERENGELIKLFGKCHFVLN